MAFTVLVVEDDQDIQENLRLILELKDYGVLTASNGIEALEKMEQEVPDLILLDLMMPEMDGVEFSIQLKHRKLLPTVPMIIVTACGHMKFIGNVVGAVDFVTKPYDVDNLLALVARFENNKPLAADALLAA